MRPRFKQPLRATIATNKAAMLALPGVDIDRVHALFASAELNLPKARGPRVARDEDPANPLEASVLKAVLAYLRVHPKIATVWRMQSGLFGDGERMVRVGMVGLPDIIGMLKGGRLYGCEVKRPSGRPTEAQERVLRDIRLGGGLAFVARSIDDCKEALRDA